MAVNDSLQHYPFCEICYHWLFCHLFIIGSQGRFSIRYLIRQSIWTFTPCGELFRITPCGGLLTFTPCWEGNDFHTMLRNSVIQTIRRAKIHTMLRNNRIHTIWRFVLIHTMWRNIFIQQFGGSIIFTTCNGYTHSSQMEFYSQYHNLEGWSY